MRISHRKGQRYLTVVVDHDSGRLVWACPCRDKKTVEAFFDALGDDRCAKIRLVVADAAGWIGEVVADRCPNAVRCLDPFHVVAWAADALDEVRRQTWNAARRAGQRGVARELEGARYALWRNPEDLVGPPAGQAGRHYRQNQPAAVPGVPAQRAAAAGVPPRQRACGYQPARTLVGVGAAVADLRVRQARAHRPRAQGRDLRRGVSRAVQRRVESLNTKLRLITRRAFGFHSPEALIAFAMLAHGGLCPPLPGRTS